MTPTERYYFWYGMLTGLLTADASEEAIAVARSQVAEARTEAEKENP